MKRLSTTILAASLVLGSSAAMAVDQMPPAGPYVGVGVGVDFPYPNTATVDGGPARPKFKPGWLALINGGYKWDSGFRVEGELSYRQDKAKDVNAANIPLTGKMSDTSVMANILYDFSTGTRFTPYIGGGIGISDVNMHNLGVPAAGTTFHGNSTKFTWQGIVGAAFEVAPQWAVTAEFRYKGSNNHRYSSTAGDTINDFDHRTHDVILGLRYSFGAPAKQAEAAPPPPPPAPIAQPQRAPAPPVPQKFLVFFDFDKSNVRTDAKKIISEAADYAKKNGKASITATGHTDTSGTDAYNMALSERRAKAVQAELEKIGIPAGEIVIHWKGESEPLVQTGDGVREPQNRRVEIIME